MDSNDYPVIDIDQLVHKLEPMPDGGLVFLVGIPASGKSSLAAELEARGFVWLNGDNLREELLGDASDQSSRDRIYQAMRQKLAQAVTYRNRVVLDVMNVTRKLRRGWLSLARQHGCTNIHQVVLDTDFVECLIRNENRDRVVPEALMRDMYTSMMQSGAPGEDEGILHVLAPGPDSKHYLVVPPEDLRRRRPGKLPPLGAGRPKPEADTDFRVKKVDGAGIKLDIIGDVHGCYDELLDLLKLLGYRFNLDIQRDGSFRDFRWEAPEPGRKVAFVGDFADRGPFSDKVLALAAQLIENDLAEAVLGNHDEKLWRHLRGNGVVIGANLGRTIAQIDAYGKAFNGRLCLILGKMPHVYETDDLILVHGAYREKANPAQARSLCLYGETDGTEDEHGFTRRWTRWEDEYAGSKNIFRGHDVEVEPRLVYKSGGNVIGNLDTGCVFGGKLTAMRYPERQLFSIPARRAYAGRFLPK